VFGIDVVAMRGGLGNQLFAWAYARGLQAHGHRLRLSYTGQYGRERCLTGLVESSSIVEIAPRAWSAIARRTAPISRIPGASVTLEDGHQGGSGALRFHWGYWQSPRYFADCAEQVKSDVRTWLQVGSQESYGAVHVRRGDYVSNSGAAATLGALPLDYYARATELLRARGFGRIVIVSDDPSWARANAAAIAPGATTVDVADGRSWADDFRVLARAGGIAISNSTFSWWAAFIGAGASADELVIAPSPWYRGGDPTPWDLLSDSWTLVEAPR